MDHALTLFFWHRLVTPGLWFGAFFILAGALIFILARTRWDHNFAARVVGLTWLSGGCFFAVMGAVIAFRDTREARTILTHNFAVQVAPDDDGTLQVTLTVPAPDQTQTILGKTVTYTPPPADQLKISFAEARLLESALVADTQNQGVAARLAGIQAP